MWNAKLCTFKVLLDDICQGKPVGKLNEIGWVTFIHQTELHACKSLFSSNFVE